MRLEEDEINKLQLWIEETAKPICDADLDVRVPSIFYFLFKFVSPSTKFVRRL